MKRSASLLGAATCSIALMPGSGLHAQKRGFTGLEGGATFFNWLRTGKFFRLCHSQSNKRILPVNFPAIAVVVITVCDTCAH